MIVGPNRLEILDASSCVDTAAVLVDPAAAHGVCVSWPRRRGDPMPLKVIQWTTGNVGRRSLRAIVAHPDLDLVGVYAHGPDKVGRAAAALCGLDGDLGVRATDDIDELVDLGADACS